MRAEATRQRAQTSPAIQKIAVVVNRNAGGISRNPRLTDTLKRVVGDTGEILSTSDEEDLRRAIARARMLGVDTIGICGGDGTNLHTLTMISEVYRSAPWPRIALLGGGTLNTAASHFRLSGPVPSRLRLLIGTAEPRSLSWPLLRVNEHVGFIFGSLMVARVLDEYYRGRVDPIGASLLAARIVASAALQTSFTRALFHSERVEVEIDGVRLGRNDYSCLLAAVVSSPAVGMRALYKAGEDGAFHLLGTSASPGRIFREAGRAWCGLPMSTSKIDTTAYRATLRFEEPTRYTMDGDLFSAQTIELTATEPVELLLPPIP